MAKCKQKLSVLECYDPTQWGKDGWIFSSLGTAFEYFSRGMLTSPLCRKLMIFYVASYELCKPPTLVNEVASWHHPLDADLMPIKHHSYSEICRNYFPFFSQGIKDAFAEINVKGDYRSVLTHMEESNFLFSGKLKEINREWSLEWRYERDIEYYFRNKERNAEIPLFKLRCRSIRHKDFFSKFSINANELILSKTRSEDYWIFDIKKESVTYISARAMAGQAHGQYDLAKMYLDGHLVQRNLDTAKEWLEKSAAQGFRRAQELLKKLADSSLS